jgi:predicted transcriptional regulator
MKTSVVTTRLDEDSLARLDLVCQRQERSRAWIISKAVKQLVDEEIAFHDFIQEGEDAIDRGEVYTQEEMVEWVRSLRRTADAA